MGKGNENILDFPGDKTEPPLQDFEAGSEGTLSAPSEL